jgi:hypothetical protein
MSSHHDDDDDDDRGGTKRTREQAQAQAGEHAPPSWIQGAVAHWFTLFPELQGRIAAATGSVFTWRTLYETKGQDKGDEGAAMHTGLRQALHDIFQARYDAMADACVQHTGDEPLNLSALVHLASDSFLPYKRVVRFIRSRVRLSYEDMRALAQRVAEHIPFSEYGQAPDHMSLQMWLDARVRSEDEDGQEERRFLYDLGHYLGSLKRTRDFHYAMTVIRLWDEYARTRPGLARGAELLPFVGSAFAEAVEWLADRNEWGIMRGMTILMTDVFPAMRPVYVQLWHDMVTTYMDPADPGAYWASMLLKGHFMPHRIPVRNYMGRPLPALSADPAGGGDDALLWKQYADIHLAALVAPNLIQYWDAVVQLELPGVRTREMEALRTAPVLRVTGTQVAQTYRDPIQAWRAADVYCVVDQKVWFGGSRESRLLDYGQGTSPFWSRALMDPLVLYIERLALEARGSDGKEFLRESVAKIPYVLLLAVFDRIWSILAQACPQGPIQWDAALDKRGTTWSTAQPRLRESDPYSNHWETIEIHFYFFRNRLRATLKQRFAQRWDAQ